MSPTRHASSSWRPARRPEHREAVQRSDRATWLAQVDDLRRTLLTQAKKQDPAIELWRDLRAFVVDPEVFRALLIKRLHDRARSLHQGSEALLNDLPFDHSAGQRQEVELSLSIDGVVELTLR